MSCTGTGHVRNGIRLFRTENGFLEIPANLCDFLRIVVNRRVQTVSEQIKCLEKTVCLGQKVKDGGVYIRI